MLRTTFCHFWSYKLFTFKIYTNFIYMRFEDICYSIRYTTIIFKLGYKQNATIIYNFTKMSFIFLDFPWTEGLYQINLFVFLTLESNAICRCSGMEDKHNDPLAYIFCSLKFCRLFIDQAKINMNYFYMCGMDIVYINYYLFYVFT